MTPARRIVAWIVPGALWFDVVRVWALSLTVALFFLWTGAITVLTGATGYQAWAAGLVRRIDLSGLDDLAWRDIGYPIILILSGFPFTHSYLGVVVLQTLMGVSMPILVYLMLRPWFPNTAYFTALFSALSLAPFLMMKVIHHDQTYTFFMLLSLFLLSRFIATNQARNLYAMSASIFAMSLTRLLGKVMFPGLLLIAAVHRRGHPLHYLLVSVAFIACTLSYSAYRDLSLGTPKPIAGIQLFYNVYINSGTRDGTDLSLVPGMQPLIDRARAEFSPSPSESPILRSFGAPADFAEQYFFRYSTDELIARLFSEPNWEYFVVLVRLSAGEAPLLDASISVAETRPSYVLGYLARNAWKLLFDPGWTHAQYNSDGLVREGSQFPLSGGPQAYGFNIGDSAPHPALAEARFLPLARFPMFVRDIYFAVEAQWRALYLPVIRASFVLTLVAWFATLVGLAGRLFGARWLDWCSEVLLAERTLAASLGITAMLVANVFITALLVDPLYRYDFSLLLLKFMLAGIGASIVVSVCRSAWALVFLPTWQRPPAEASPLVRSTQRTPPIRSAAAIVAAVGVLGIGSWVGYMSTVAVAAPVPGTVDVRSATFGGNCGADRDNVLQDVASACSGMTECSYVFDWRFIANPAASCAKSLEIKWECADRGDVRTTILPPEPQQWSTVGLSCRK